MSDTEPIVDGHRPDPNDHYRPIECRSIVETPEGGPDEWTVFPLVSEEPLGTIEWTTARRDSYVAIGEML